MSQMKKIKSRISSVRNTGQITQAMKMVATARLRKAQERILNLRPYAAGLFSLMADVAKTCRIHHPLLVQETSSAAKTLLIVLTSDRGLCGGFNNNICRKAEEFYRQSPGGLKPDLFFIGRKGKNYFQFRQVLGVQEMFQLDREVSYPLAGVVARRLMESFTKGKYERIDFIYNSFKSVISQEVVKERFLPVDISKASVENQNRFSKDLIFEIPPEDLLKELLNKHFTVQVYRCMCESVAAEYGARMSAMENATKNAADMISRLTLSFNKQRQGAITTELTEVSSGAEAMNF